jgi:hypothetical protein
MAWIFSLAAECGTEPAAAAFAAYFADQHGSRADDRPFQATPSLFQDLDDNWWCRVVPDGLSQIGVDAPDAAYQMTELGIALYQRLRTAPVFRYAIVGVEVDEFRTYGELCEETSLGQFKGLVLSAAIHQVIADRSTFRPFSPGYLWVPYEGEVYQPLLVSPMLKQQMSDLLVA